MILKDDIVTKRAGIGSPLCYNSQNLGSFGGNMMSVILLLSRIALAVVFGLAGVTKIFDLKGSRTAMLDFGLPQWLAAPLGSCLPFLELAVAGLLLPTETVWWGALGALVLLVAFVVGIAINMARGKRPDCHCFGQLHSAPVGPITLVRNGLLAALAGLVVSQAWSNPGLSVSSVLGSIFAGHVVEAAFGTAVVLAIACLSYLIVHLFRQNGRLLLRIESLESAPIGAPRLTAQNQAGLKIGSPAPAFELPLAKGGQGSLDSLRAGGKPVVLVFSDANCGPCKALIPDLERWDRQYADKLTIAMVTRGASVEKIKHYLRFVLVQKDREVAMQYQAFGTPAAVVVGADGLVRTGLASGAQKIGELVSAAASGNLPAVQSAPAPLPRPSALPIGSSVPALTLPDLAGNKVQLGDLLGRQTLLLFWNPGCGYCNRMLPDLKHWEAARDGNAPRLVLMTAGTAEQNRAMGLSSTVLLDQTHSASQVFGAGGTPSALLLDADGKVASNLAMGADAIFALVGGKAPAVALAARNGN
jgi:thiol-disulfide isomerase/thioredoxin